ncbi:hypothetical protein [Cellulomonas alba]|uniref:MFS transporter n=1 Tax=Cellulomonas alba TaxID=3053467 RepID=A0ABT7SIW9_9CELL|nr:hypothetical protein [Cellulomonas alba]MDM7855509.1 hypothetical protein [Cellulomonas alba]
MTTPPEPQSAPADLDDEAALVRPLSRIAYAFCAALVAIGLLGAFVLVPDPVVTLGGLALGLGLGLVSLVVPPLLIRGGLRRGTGRTADPASEHAVVRTAVFIGLAFAELPALVALSLVASDGNHDVGALLISVPFAIVSLLVNVAGAGAVRRHLRRIRGGVA